MYKVDLIGIINKLKVYQIVWFIFYPVNANQILIQTYGPTDIKASVLELIGNTPLLALDRLWPGPGRLLVKCEFLNPSASVKDRSAYYMIKNALKKGVLKPKAPIVEVSSGNHGCGLALVGAVLGNPVTIAMSAGNSPQRAEMMKAFGANVTLASQVEGTPGRVAPADLVAVNQLGLKIAKNTGAYYMDQHHNKDNILAHEETTGAEIWRQTGGRVDAFLAAVGTAGTFVGVSRYLKKQNKNIVCVAVEPKGSEVIRGQNVTKSLHILQGSGSGIVPKLFDYNTLDMTSGITDEEALHYKKLLGVMEGLYVGYTSGANVAAAVKLLKSGKLAKDAWVVTVLPDSGLKYPPNEK